MQRLLKPLCKRTALVFSLFLLYSVTKKFLLSPDTVVQNVNIIDRKYQLTLNLLKDRPRQKLEMYRDHVSKTGVFVSRSDPTLCLQSTRSEERGLVVVTVNKCEVGLSSQLWTMDRYRNSDKVNTLSLDNRCIDIGKLMGEPGVPFIMYDCHGSGPQSFTHDFTAGLIYHEGQNKCLDTRSVALGGEVTGTRCSLLEEGQKWEFRESGEGGRGVKRGHR